MIRFFITRPENQAGDLMTALNKTNKAFMFEHWPVFKIEDIELTGKDHTRLYNFDEYDYVFVASKTAAKKLLDQLDERWAMLPIGPKFICPGSATANVLSATGLEIFFPEHKTESEAVLGLPMFSQLELLKQKKWLIVSGSKGRRKIQEFLTLMNNQVVDELDLYQRTALEPALENHPKKDDVVVVTSSESLLKIEQHLKENTQNLNLWVSSERIKQQAINWQSITVLQNALDQTIIQAVECYEQ